jgi:hypothetical protein
MLKTLIKQEPSGFLIQELLDEPKRLKTLLRLCAQHWQHLGQLAQVNPIPIPILCPRGQARIDTTVGTMSIKEAT